jgi:hypothetical protein
MHDSQRGKPVYTAFSAKFRVNYCFVPGFSNKAGCLFEGGTAASSAVPRVCKPALAFRAAESATTAYM